MNIQDYFDGFCKGECAAQSLRVGERFWGAFPDNPYSRETTLGAGWHNGYLDALPRDIWTNDEGIITSLGA